MKNLFTNIIMTIVSILIIGVLSIFGIIIWEEIKPLEETYEPEGVETVFSTSEEEETFLTFLCLK